MYGHPGNDAGGVRAAAIYTPIEACKLNRGRARIAYHVAGKRIARPLPWHQGAARHQAAELKSGTERWSYGFQLDDYRAPAAILAIGHAAAVVYYVLGAREGVTSVRRGLPWKRPDTSDCQP